VNEVEAEVEGEGTPPDSGVAVVSGDKKFKGKMHPKKQDAATNCDPGEGSAPPSSQNLSNANATAGSNSLDSPPSRIGVEDVVGKVGKVEKASQVVEKAKVVMVDEAKESGMTIHGVKARERGRGRVLSADGARGWGMGPPTVPMAV
jgi:hypothetical protein